MHIRVRLLATALLIVLCMDTVPVRAGSWTDISSEPAVVPNVTSSTSLLIGQSEEPSFATAGADFDQVVTLPIVIGLPASEKYPADDRAFELEVLRLINEERTNAGLPLLSEDVSLTHAARRHAKDMMSSGQRGHIGSDGTSPTQRMMEEGFVGTPWTEASNFNYSTPRGVVAAWLASSLHRNIVLDSTANRIGLGYAVGANAQFDHTAVIDMGVVQE
jgi:uncharacterized protein YkwD